MEVEPLTNNVGMKKRYYQEHIWNLGTFWEPKGNPPLLPQPKTQKKETKPHGAFSLAAWNFYFDKGFSNGTNTPNCKLGVRISNKLSQVKIQESKNQETLTLV